MGDIKLYIKIVIIVVFTIISGKHAMAATLEVGPSGYEFISIQAAIDSSSYGDEVLVYDGIYKENIDFQGKRIIVRSVHGAYRTIIDSASSESVVKFRSAEGTDSRLDGFSIRNGSDLRGSGIYCNSSSPTIANCIISDNYLQKPYGNSTGGGIYCAYNSSPTIINCIINNNTASSGGGIYCWYYSSPKIINCTISNNNASSYGGGICCTYHSSPTVVNSIFWGNTTGESSVAIYLGSDCSINVTYSDIQNASGVYPGAGNINANPLFVQIGNADYYLGKDSPCIDKGNPTNAPPEDQERIPRPQGSGIDMGAYEYVDPLYCTPRALFTANLETGVAPLEVEFDASSSGGSQYTGTVFSWDFGDGSTGMGMTASHVYSAFGSYDVTLTITTECGYHTIILYDLIKVRSTHVTKEVGEGHAYASIQEAITDADYGEIILVHDGTYRESINFNGKAITLRSENGAANTFIDGNTNGTVVTFDHGEGAGSILDGFTIQNGSEYKGGGISCTNGSSPVIANCSILNNNASLGSGVSCDNSSPEFYNCHIYSNVASIEGGGIYCAHESMPVITNCIFYDNNAYNKGGGICCEADSSLIITKCTIANNRAGSDGGGIYCYYSSPSITNSVISSNNANKGGGIYFYHCSPAVTNCTISDNISIYNGGGIFCHHSSPEIINCSINGNMTESDGGGIYCAYSTPIIINCSITGNIAEREGGGIYCSRSSSPEITNCTISSNTAVFDGGGIHCNDDSSSPIISNCILWNDSPQEISVEGENSPVITYSDIYQKTDVYPGIGNINANPSFVGSDVGNYYLMADSPCIDMGTSTNAPSEDKEGIARPQGAGTDMGAYEYVESASCTPRASFTVNQTKGISPLTVEFDASSSGGSQYSGAVFSWDFGDGTSGSGLTASHTYTGYGYYDVILTISTGCGSHRLTLEDLIKTRSGQLVIKEVGEGYAYTSIQAAIDDADYGETVLVHDGTYIENINFKGKEITVRSEHGAASTIITANDSIDGRLVTFDHREGTDSVLDGFTIQNASLVGVSCHSSSPAITNCIIKDNTDNGVYCIYSSPQITNCTISGNRNNGIYCQDSSPIITGCRIHNNNNYGISCSSSSSSTITSCTISRNMRGGIYCRYSSPGITNCTISGNRGYEGAGIYCYHASPNITNCTIIDNTADYEGGGISCRNSSPSITNCIIWNSLPQEIYIGSPIVTYSNIKQEEGVYPGIGNINADPLFVGGDEGNYYLTADSPCIDAGTSTNAPSEDKEGIPRPQGAGIDMGTYEYVESTSCTPRASFIVNQTKGTDSLTVEFDASSSGGSQYSGATFSWDFGDGATGSDMASSHTYTSIGSYDVSLTISTECGTHWLILYDLIKISSYQASKEVGKGYAYTSIQAAIDDADYGEIILVHDGIYIESINFKGKAIIVRSEHGASSTIIDGSETDTVVTFDHGEGAESQLDGFTLQNAPHNDGIYCLYASPVIVNCTITANRGGGIYCHASSPTITNCTIIDNGGKGIDCFHSSPEITNCIISGNRAGGSDGGGIDCASSSPKITNCTISNNTAEESGGGIYCSSSSPEITNCIISGNKARFHGGGICCSNLSLPKITNCTISNNTSEEDGGGVYCTHGSSPTITNCILWINSPQEISIYGEDSPTITYSDIYQETGLYPGVQNINADPLFMNGEEGNYYLMADSPCIDKGTSTNAPSEDKEGIARPEGAGIDMGAYEYVEPASCTPRALFTINQTEGTDSLTVEFDASSSGGSQYSGATFSWDFGDGSTGSEMTSSHTYTSNGFHDVSLTISTECGSHMLILNDLIKIKSSQVTKEVGEGYAYTSIQAAIDDAVYGDVILVHDGTYIEHINFIGKMITVRSENGAAATIIDGSGSEKVVTFNHSEGIDSLLDGFTIKNGSDRGIFIENSSPMIANCRIIENALYGIYCHNAIARVLNCLLRGNSATEISSQIFFLKDNSGAYKNIQILNQTNDSRACVQRYDQVTGRWQAHYRFFGKPSSINTPLLPDEFLFISFLP